MRNAGTQCRKCDENIPLTCHDLFACSVFIALCHILFLPINRFFYLSQTFFFCNTLAFFPVSFLVYVPAKTHPTVDRITEFVE